MNDDEYRSPWSLSLIVCLGYSSLILVWGSLAVSHHSIDVYIYRFRSGASLYSLPMFILLVFVLLCGGRKIEEEIAGATYFWKHAPSGMADEKSSKAS
ncbi:hypothetical protein GLOTRDRAFT_100382 [Gloeophyllum trabeum ATCC 11539]|uniref:Uncharacterized protein n=1 Tax=Gloeophyllum trabeum (strain ATCC 11539 / FP-39264 / Madison 617) TaxID=670483 RepID=S7RPU0_GLOTA|nr:uncharacterized protein GLOTRDRAFT_100382 [Gloeophyllum trabeum ATCC 11539]EPQ54904.1 hypothetical protein GLOTRDRAFT_100382 [Gloeophyllum trabeum ATCC 11539]